MKSLKVYVVRVLFCLLVTTPFMLMAQDPDKNKPAAPADEAAELAKKLANPVASLISVPFQNNTFYGIGPNKGTQNVMNIQPVVPITLTKGLNLITRYIVPIVTQYNVTGENSSQSGLSDATISAFLSPSKVKNGLVWGAGPAFLIPTATDKYLGTGKFGIGPTIVALKQTHGITYGVLANQIWSVAGQGDRAAVSQMFVQPFFTYNWKSGAGIGLVGSITQDWESKTTVSSIAIPFTGITKFGKQIVSLGVGPQIPISGPNKADFGWRAQLVLIFPK